MARRGEVAIGACGTRWSRCKSRPHKQMAVRVRPSVTLSQSSPLVRVAMKMWREPKLGSG